MFVFVCVSNVLTLFIRIQMHCDCMLCYDKIIALPRVQEKKSWH